MSSRIRVSKKALADMDEIWEYVALQKNPEMAEQVVDSIVDRFSMLSKMAEAGRRREEIQPEARSFPEGNYIIDYRKRRGGIEISRVIHVKRDLRKAWKARGKV
jgi:toxin ParE1/3/4